MGSLPLFGKAHEGSASSDFTWFIYGSSLDRAAFAAWAEQHGYRLPDLDRGVPARLDGFRLAFDVVSRSWGGTVASLAESPAGHVEGIALPLPGAARGLADHKEGAVSGLYLPFQVQVVPLAGGPAIEAIAYRASPSRRLASEAPPAPRYLAAVIDGARHAHLSPSWIGELERIAAGAAG
jgi:hypothetical protein